MSYAPEQLERFARGLVEQPELWEHLVRHEDDLRVYEQIWDDEHVNAWLICWSEDQDTGFHDHDESAAAIVVMEGQVREDRLCLAPEPVGRVVGAGETFHVPPTAIHRVLHAGDQPAVTIHAYSPPLRRTGTYRLSTGGALERTAQAYELELRAEPALG